VPKTKKDENKERAIDFLLVEYNALTNAKNRYSEAGVTPLNFFITITPLF
jgi:hypothetical protein